MLAVERRKKIMIMLNDHGSVVVANLSKQLKVTEETIRRDLEKLEKEGKLQRTHGGAYLSGRVMDELPVSFREQVYLPGKDLIAFRSAEMISNGETIMLDSSTTSLRIAKYLKHIGKKITVITNSLKVINELVDVNGIKVVSTGGTLRTSSQSFIGYTATANLKTYFADKAFVSCTAIHAKKGLMDSNESEAEVRKHMLLQAEERVLVADITKFGKTSFCLISDFDLVEKVVVDQHLSKEWHQNLTAFGIKIIDEDTK